MQELEFKKAALELREKDLVLKEYKLEIKKRELALLGYIFLIYYKYITNNILQRFIF